MKKVNIGLSDEIHAQAKIISVLKKITLQEYLQDAIESAVKKDRAILGKVRGEKEEIS
ncbi:MAG: hypothetical protein QXW00_00570 [Candidatus Woesearchaeota archaeon]